MDKMGEIRPENPTIKTLNGSDLPRTCGADRSGQSPPPWSRIQPVVLMIIRNGNDDQPKFPAPDKRFAPADSAEELGAMLHFTSSEQALRICGGENLRQTKAN